MRCPSIRVAILAALLLSAPRPASPAALPPDSLIGLWSVRLDLGPAVRGDLRLERRGTRWRAEIAGHSVAFDAIGDSLRFELPQGAGAFRGVRRDRAIAGFWLQPVHQGLGQRFATPLTLRPAGRGTWRGTVEPLPDRFTLFLQVFRNEFGVVVGAFRNPERNSIGGANRYRLFRDGDSLWFNLRADSTLPWDRYVSGSLTRDPERIRVRWPELDRTLELARCTADEAADFFPRAGRDTNAVYRRPPALGDGWPTARAREVGMDEAALAGIVGRLARLDPAARRPVLIHSLLVARHGRLVLEEYFFGHDRETPHDLRSAGKTLGSVMLGAAMREGAPLDPGTPVAPWLAARGPFANPDPRKQRITLAHLLTHTSGLACDDNDPSSPGSEDAMQSQRAQPDWWRFAFDVPMAHEPGTRYAYASAGMNLVGAVLTAATGSWLPEYFDRAIARPLDFGRYHWNLMPNGEGYLGGGAHLRPRDLLKIGQLFLDGGVWRGRRIVDSSWVSLSTTARLEVSPATTGLTPERFEESYLPSEEGLAWHLSRPRAGGREYREYAATGNGGQLLIVIPELDVAVVITAGNYGQGGIWARYRHEMIPGELLPAVTP